MEEGSDAIMVAGDIRNSAVRQAARCRKGFRHHETPASLPTIQGACRFDLRQRSEQNFTRSQSRSHFFRHVKGRPQH
jgi:hypothetical protein